MDSSLDKSVDEISFDLVIVGGGLVGASFACMLSELPIRVGLIDSAVWNEFELSKSYDTRVVALSKRVEKLLANLNVWPEQHGDRCCAYTKMHVWDREGTGQIDFAAEEIGEDRLGTIIENQIVLKHLRNKISTSKNIEVLQLQTVKDIDVSSKLANAVITLNDDSTISASLVVAADGGKSILREKSGISSWSWDYGHSAIVTTVKHSGSHNFAAWQSFSVDGPLAFLPLSDSDGEESCYSSIVWSLTRDLAEDLMALQEKHFIEKLEIANESRLGSIQEIGERFCFPLSQNHAKTYIKPSFALIGDSAHIIHPLAGQGVNLGIYDAQVLYEEIQRAVVRHIPLSDFSILRRYERKRMSQNLMATGAMESFKQLFGTKDLSVRWLRNTGMKFFNRHQLAKRQFIKLANGEI